MILAIAIRFSQGKGEREKLFLIFAIKFLKFSQFFILVKLFYLTIVELIFIFIDF